MFSKDVFPDPLGPSIALKRPDWNFPSMLFRIVIGSPSIESESDLLKFLQAILIKS